MYKNGLDLAVNGNQFHLVLCMEIGFILNTAILGLARLGATYFYLNLIFISCWYEYIFYVIKDIVTIQMMISNIRPTSIDYRTNAFYK